ncbi:MAG TPA: OpgC domain-containing protein, partial [Gemmatimonadaceae bacterium]
MKILATLPTKGRDLRLDLFRGVANWGIFLDHIPNNVVNWVTTRNYGFSDAADLFIFISGYTVAFVFARMMLERGFIIGASRLLKRVWQIYVAHVFLFVLYLAEIGYLAQRYGNSGFTDEFNIRGFLANPAQFLFEGLILRFKPVNMDVLPLYIVLMGVFPPILWLMLRRPNMTLAA